MIRRLIASLVLMFCVRVCGNAVDYDQMISYFSKDEIKQVAEDLPLHERVDLFFDASDISDWVYLPKSDISEFFKYLFWAFDHQKYWIRIYPFKQLDYENPEPTCFMVIFEMNF